MKEFFNRLRHTSVAKYGLASLVPRTLAILTTLIITPLAIAELGLSGFGFWVLATQIPSMVVSPDLGLTQGLVNELGPIHRRSGSLESERDRLFDVQRLLGIIALIWLIMGLAAAYIYTDSTQTAQNRVPLFASLGVALVIFVLGIPAMVWTRAQLAQERGHEYVLAEGVGKAASLVLSIVVILLAPSPVALVAAFMGPATLASWWNARLYTRREFGQAVRQSPPGRLRTIFRSERNLFHTGGYFVIMQVAFLLGTSIDPYIIGAFVDTDGVAYVNVIKRPFDFLPLTVTLFAPSLWPLFLRLRDSRDYSRMARILIGVTGGSALIMSALSALIVLLRAPLYDFLGAGTVTPSPLELVACSLLVIAVTIATVVGSYLKAADLIRSQAMILLVGALMGLALKTLALTYHGVTAYLVVAAVAYLMLTTLPLCLLTAWSLSKSRRDPH